MNTCANCAYQDECRWSSSDDHCCNSWMRAPKSNPIMLLVVGAGFWLVGVAILFGLCKLFGAL